MTKKEIEATFRGAVTEQIAGGNPLLAFGDDKMGVEDLLFFAGLGVAMTANMLKLWAESLEAEPADMWRFVCEKGPELGLPGMS